MKGIETAFEPFTIATCEALADGRHLPQLYEPADGQPFAPFEIYDPFGLRNAIVPVFRQHTDGRMYGMGTAFHVDGFGGFLTAYHVVDFVEEDHASRPVLFHGMHAVVYGTVVIPSDCFVPATEVVVPMVDVVDPLAALRGQSVREPAIDVASLRASEIGPGARAPQTLPVRTSGWIPRHGEIVLAVGFPELDLSELNDADQSALLTEGMYGAYGRIVAIHPNGVSSSNPTPVFQVESDWPSGMSGGPVFNRSGEVVGIVSRSLRGDPGMVGVGYAAHFAMAPDLPRLMPLLSGCGPGWRSCWGVFSRNGDVPVSIHATREDAEMAVTKAGEPHEIKAIENRIGTIDFMNLAC
ncbi:S1 family peptidase [Ralstonia pseudosolanacearum]|uniref:S1 family peptidase n=1 Tax=Ralstonia pseudosolanacearum TaxID=1310165 RepID=UPI0009BE5FDE|nr:serine protease [Ralstonia pseudosolanacearum]